MNELWRINDKSDVVEKWVPKDRFDVLLTLARTYESECGECNGTGETPLHFDCVACADIRAAIAKATQP